MALQQDSERFPLPTDPAEFDSDERISFSKLDNKFIAVQDDGTELEFDNQLRRWVPILDEELLREQQKAYMVPGVEDTVEAAQNPRKRKKGATNGDEVSYGRMTIGARRLGDAPGAGRGRCHQIINSRFAHRLCEQST